MIISTITNLKVELNLQKEKYRKVILEHKEEIKKHIKIFEEVDNLVINSLEKEIENLKKSVIREKRNYENRRNMNLEPSMRKDIDNLRVEIEKLKSEKEQYSQELNKIRLAKKEIENELEKQNKTLHRLRQIAIAQFELTNDDKVYDYNTSSYQRRRRMENALPSDISTSDLKKIVSHFNNNCALTGKAKPTLDHFIALSTGHGGYIKGNIYPLDRDLNLHRKKDLNPFEWYYEVGQRDIEQDKWDKLINYLASQNDLSVREFTDYVNWCYSNKRNIEQVEHDKGKTSIELWRVSKEIKNIIKDDKSISLISRVLYRETY
jgi:hypothetical protein